MCMSNLWIARRKDGDGDLSFGEFCQGLAKIGYVGDVCSLWRELGGDVDNCLTLQAVDFSGAEIVGYFSNWCQATFSGPFEFFTKLDDDGSNSLTAEEFSEGLEQYGCFDGIFQDSKFTWRSNIFKAEWTHVFESHCMCFLRWNQCFFCLKTVVLNG